MVPAELDRCMIGWIDTFITDWLIISCFLVFLSVYGALTKMMVCNIGEGGWSLCLSSLRWGHHWQACLTWRNPSDKDRRLSGGNSWWRGWGGSSGRVYNFSLFFSRTSRTLYRNRESLNEHVDLTVHYSCFCSCPLQTGHLKSSWVSPSPEQSTCGVLGAFCHSCTSVRNCLMYTASIRWWVI